MITVQVSLSNNFILFQIFYTHFKGVEFEKNTIIYNLLIFLFLFVFIHLSKYNECILSSKYKNITKIHFITDMYKN